MKLGAQKSDWHSDNPNVRPALWFGALFGAFVFCILMAAVVGKFVNGDGSPFLS